jgi:hypothetical protein
MLNLGATMGQPLMGDVKHRRRAARGLFHGRLVRMVTSPVDALREVLSGPEAGPRVAELRLLAREVGWRPGTPMTPDQAVRLAIAARRVTVDFGAWGSAGKVLNQIIPFYNPAIQGARAFVRTAKNRPWRTLAWGLGALTVPALLNWWRNRDQEWYRAMPWRDRYLYTNVDDGTRVWQLPRAFEWGNAFQVIPEAILDTWYQRDPEAATAALKHIFETTNPLDLPVLLRTAKEQWQNRIDFWDRPIVPRGEVDLVPGAQYGEYTSDFAKELGRIFPNVSPRRVDAAVRSIAGGVGGDLLSAFGAGRVSDREREASDVPVVGRLVRRGGHFSSSDRRVSEFYDRYLRLDSEVRTASKRQTRIDPRKLAALSLARRRAQEIKLLTDAARSARELATRERMYRGAGRLAEAANRVMDSVDATVPQR